MKNAKGTINNARVVVREKQKDIKLLIAEFYS